MRELKVLSQAHWPIVAALAFARHLTEPSQNKLLESASYRQICKRPGYKENQGIIFDLSKRLSISTLKEVEGILEKSLSEDVRKLEGAVYTPDYIIDFIVEECLDQLSPKDHLGTTILDPACGSGGFLHGALRRISDRTGESFSDISKRLYGFDKNLEAVQNARLLLDLATLYSCGELSNAKIEMCDTLITPSEDQLSIIGQTSGVSIVATNPPYVKLQTLSESYRAQLAGVLPDVASGAFSLATLFLRNSGKYLKTGGVAGFITLNNLFTSISAKSLRQHWSETREVYKILDFRHFPVFHASAYTCLIFMNKKSNSSILFSAINSKPSDLALKRQEYSEVPYVNLKADKWRLATKPVLDLITKLEERGTKLNSVSEIRAGIATLFDKAYVCSNSGSGYTAIGGDNVERKIEDGIVHKFTKVAELSTSRQVSSVQQGIIYPYSKQSASREIITWSEITSNFPNAAQHLLSWKPRLLKRSGAKHGFWYIWGRRQSMISQGPKLLTKTFDKYPTFHLDETDGLFANGYSVRPSGTNPEFSVEQLRAFLESRFMYAYALVTSFEIEGGYQCYQKNFIENISLPPSKYIPKDGSGIEPNSRVEERIAEFYGFSIDNLDSCLRSYLS